MTSTNGSTTATVETLVAEVRVLQVGRRQITKSVANQLDTVPIDEIELFGPIRVSDWGGPDRVELIGRCIKTNALVTSWASINGREGFRVSRERLAELEALPLIVLAGLR